eukprot:8807484-Karenia_brevis.AAC.1
MTTTRTLLALCGSYVHVLEPRALSHDSYVRMNSIQQLVMVLMWRYMGIFHPDVHESATTFPN